MALFLIEHRHTDETCPTHNLDMVRALCTHVTRENAERYGVKLLADWVNEPEHRVIFVVEAEEQGLVDRFAGPFGRVGEVTVTQGLTCERVAIDCLSSEPDRS